MIKFLKIISFIIVSCFFSKFVNAEVVYIDLDKIMRTSTSGISLNKYIDEQQKKALEKFKKKENDFKNREKKILSQKNILKKDEIQSKIKKLQDEVKIYNQEKKKTIDELNKKKLKLTKQILDELNPVLANYMETNSISIILRKKDIIIGKNSLNVTDKIILLLNDKISQIKIN